jgi:hypothetical protein
MCEIDFQQSAVGKHPSGVGFELRGAGCKQAVKLKGQRREIRRWPFVKVDG